MDCAGSGDVVVRHGDWELFRAAASKCRLDVFVGEQHIPRELEMDGRDASALHFVAFSGDLPVGNARLLPSGHVGRMCVLKPFRNKSVGSFLMRSVIDVARASEYRKLVLDSQVTAKRFYQKFGFEETSSEEFYVAGIAHVEMRLFITS